MGEVDPTTSGTEGSVIRVPITAAHAERVRASEPGELLRDTGVAPPDPFTVSSHLLAEVFWSAVDIRATLARRTL